MSIPVRRTERYKGDVLAFIGLLAHEVEAHAFSFRGPRFNPTH